MTTLSGILGMGAKEKWNNLPKIVNFLSCSTGRTHFAQTNVTLLIFCWESFGEEPCNIEWTSTKLHWNQSAVYFGGQISVPVVDMIIQFYQYLQKYWLGPTPDWLPYTYTDTRFIDWLIHILPSSAKAKAQLKLSLQAELALIFIYPAPTH